jgi:hypothetical protein
LAIGEPLFNGSPIELERYQEVLRLLQQRFELTLDAGSSEFCSGLRTKTASFCQSAAAAVWCSLRGTLAA